MRTETLTWVLSTEKSVRFFYDRSDIKVVDATKFFDYYGSETGMPEQVPGKGIFRSHVPVTGSLVAHYRPDPSLLENQDGNHGG